MRKKFLYRIRSFAHRVIRAAAISFLPSTTLLSLSAFLGSVGVATVHESAPVSLDPLGCLIKLSHLLLLFLLLFSHNGLKFFPLARLLAAFFPLLVQLSKRVLLLHQDFSFLILVHGRMLQVIVVRVHG